MSNCARGGKGKSLGTFPEAYTVIDIETTGLDPSYCEIIEVAAIKVRPEGTETYQTLIRPKHRISSFITELTGITNEMVADAPAVSEVIGDFADFIGDDIIVGHNVNFDINFVYDYLESETGRILGNDFVDTVRLSRKIVPEIAHHRLCDMVEFYGIEEDIYHRAMADCVYTNKLLGKLYFDAVGKRCRISRR